MYKIKPLLLLILLLGSLTAKSQSNGAFRIMSLTTKSQSNATTAFAKFVGKTYSLPDSLKQNCEWMFAVVKVKTDNNNKIIRYEFLNKAQNVIKNGFIFLIGYQFPKSMQINGRPIVFYFSVDNTETCKPKTGDFIYYYPNQVVETIAPILFKIKEDEPKTIFISDLIIKEYAQPQNKK